ncbi:carcinoembryonic antigen-related cell adhesion molecule 3-like isoform X3 [Ovis aries]|uniref:carcinoembryonic antigen-related cell adhesion molecule 3-like isoform X3 n=1 Tax=Ovis aries TaxID=9940 RepID=UPI00100F0AC4|nr:carcinoembryonic antigen-related cell adhesion molecule 3-like isoform X3 [Ovis aries]
MESPSGPASRRHVPWSRLLLAGSLLTFWTPPTTAQLTIETVTPLAEEGSDVLLLAHNVSENTLGYSWQRGERVGRNQLITLYCVDTNDTTKGPAYSGRETLYPNGTLLIQNVTQRDTGPYTLLIKKRDLRTERQTGHLHVYRQENGQALGVGAITGIVIGVLVLMLLAVLGYFIFFHRGKRPPASTSGEWAKLLTCSVLTPVSSQDVVPLASLCPRNYYAPTQTFTVITATQIWILVPPDTSP